MQPVPLPHSLLFLSLGDAPFAAALAANHTPLKLFQLPLALFFRFLGLALLLGIFGLENVRLLGLARRVAFDDVFAITFALHDFTAQHLFAAASAGAFDGDAQITEHWVRARPRVTDAVAGVAAAHQLEALVAAALDFLLLGLFSDLCPLTALLEKHQQPTVALVLQLHLALRALAGVARELAEVATPRHWQLLALSVTGSAVDHGWRPLRDNALLQLLGRTPLLCFGEEVPVVRVVSVRVVAAPLARVVGAGQGPSALSAAGEVPGLAARPRLHVVRASAQHEHELLARQAGHLPELDPRGGDGLPRPRPLPLVHHLHGHSIVAGHGAVVLARAVAGLAHLLAGRARALVTLVLWLCRVATLAAQPTQFRASGRSTQLLSATRHNDTRAATGAEHPVGDVARVAGPGVATTAALVVAALQALATGLLAGRAIAHTTLPVAEMLPAVSQPLALSVTGELLTAGHLLYTCPTAAQLLAELQARATRPCMAAVGAVMLATCE